MAVVAPYEPHRPANSIRKSRIYYYLRKSSFYSQVVQYFLQQILFLSTYNKKLNLPFYIKSFSFIGVVYDAGKIGQFFF